MAERTAQLINAQAMNLEVMEVSVLRMHGYRPVYLTIGVISSLGVITCPTRLAAQPPLQLSRPFFPSDTAFKTRGSDRESGQCERESCSC